MITMEINPLNNFTDLEEVFSWLDTASGEIKTIQEYIIKSDACSDKESIMEITGDEFNHAIIALLQAAKAAGITVPVDGDMQELLDSVIDQDDEPGDIESWPDPWKQSASQKEEKPKTEPKSPVTSCMDLLK